MVGPIYKLFTTRMTEAWYQLSLEEQQSLQAKVAQALGSVGGKGIVMCTPAWSTEQWDLFGVEEFPDIEAVHKHTELLYELNWPRYSQGTSMLGTQWPPA